MFRKFRLLTWCYPYKMIHWFQAFQMGLSLIRLTIKLAVLTLFAGNLFGCIPNANPIPSSPKASIELYGTFHAMGVIVTIDPTAVTDADTFAGLEFRKDSEPYRPGFQLSRVDKDRFAGSLFWLEPGTHYDVIVTLSDPGGGPLDGFSITASGVTRSEIDIPPPIQSYYVSPDGAGKACSLDSPCALIEGLNQAQPGDEVNLLGGVYYEGEIALPRSGEPGAPITIRGYPGEDAIMDGADPQVFDWTAYGKGIFQTEINVRDPTLVTAGGERLFPYKNLTDLENFSWDLPGFYSRGSTLYAHLDNDVDPNALPIVVSRYETGFSISQDHIVISDLTFRHYGRVSYGKALFFQDASDNIVKDVIFSINNQDINFKGESHRNVIENNEFYDSIFNWHWEAVKKGAQYLEAGGVYANEPFTGKGNIIRRNTFHDMFDGLSICPDRTAGITNETDVYENMIYSVGDDGIQADGRCSNIRIWNNTIHDVLVGISLSPVHTGPVYAIRNTIYNTGAGVNNHDGSPFKFIYMSSSDAPVYLFHNTCHTEIPNNDGIRLGGELGKWEQIFARNNIWSGTRFALAVFTPGQTLDFDYDNLRTTSPENFVYIDGLDNPTISNLAELRATTSQENHGLKDLPIFVDPAGGDFRLSPNSSLIDAGLIIPGINDIGNYAFHGAGPDIGANEYQP